MSNHSISILGSTGSVGSSTLDVLSRHPNQFELEALTANNNVDKMLQQCLQYKPKQVVMVCEIAAEQLTHKLLQNGVRDITVDSGESALSKVSADPASDVIMSAIVGAAGLLPTLEAVRAGKRVLIANKEPLVMTGDLFVREAEQYGAVLLPIDSEHNAIFQCLPGDQSKGGVRKIHLTASGGPFRGQRWRDLASITPAQACAHPNWSMGQKISVDSATMMNKGLELIEAAALFSMPASRVEVIVHPQSIIHSLVEYRDGSFLAQLGAPDMRIPIAHALSWPERIESGAATLDLTEIARLDFEQPDMANLPCLALAKQAAMEGGGAPAALNAANELAVAAFLDEQIRFTQIPQVIESVLESTDLSEFDSLAGVLKIDNEARQYAGSKINSLRM